MAQFVIVKHAGPVICRKFSRDGAIDTARWNARQFKCRVNVYPVIDTATGATGPRVASCYPAGTLYEADIANLPLAEYRAAHEAMGASPDRDVFDTSANE